MILFRADGNAQIGSGHIMRCLSIADAFKRKNIDCLFALADSTFQPLIENRGYSVRVLNSDYCCMDSELKNLQRIIENCHPKMLIVDSYFVTESYLQKLKDFSFLVYIDDLAMFAYPVDILVNYNVNGQWHDYENLYLKKRVSCPQLLLGTAYAPLREMFHNIPKREQKPTVKDVLVSTGGADPLHLALKLAKYVEQRNVSGYTSIINIKHWPDLINYHFLVGTLNPDYRQINEIAEKNDNIQVHYNVKDMKDLISSCDLVVSAAGTTMYEILACGVPVIAYALADNQISVTKVFEKLGLAVSCGDLRKNSNAVKILMEAIDNLAGNFTLRKQISAKMQTLVDGNGADRLADMLLEIER